MYEQNMSAPIPVRAAAILTNSYVTGTVVGQIGTRGDTNIGEMYKFNNLLINIQFTIGSLTSLETRVEYSYDNSTFFITSDATGGQFEFTTTDTGNVQYLVAMKAPFVRISVKGTGTLTSSSATVDAVLITT